MSRARSCSPDQPPCFTVKSVEDALKRSASLGVLQPGVLEFFGSGIARRNKLKEFEAIGCSLMVHSLGLLAKKGQFSRSKEFQGLVADVVDEVVKPERLESFDHLSLAQLLHGFSFFPEMDALHIGIVAQATLKEEVLKKINAKTIASLLSSLARLKFKERNIIRSLAAKAVSLRTQMMDQELSNVLWSFSVVQFTDASVLDALTEQMLHPRILAAFTAQALSNVFLACARLQYANPQFIPKLLTEAVLPYRLDSYTQQHVSNIIWAVGMLKCGEKEQLEALGKQTIASSRIHSYSHIQISNIFTGWAHSGDCFDPEAYHVLLHSVLHPLNGTVKSFDSRSLARLVWSVGKLRCTQQDDFTSLIKEATIPERMADYNNQDLSNMLIGCAKRKFRDKKTIAPLLREVVVPRRLIAYNNQQLANMTWAFGEMEVQDKRVFRLFARCILESSTFCAIRPHVMMTLRGWAHSRFEYTEGLMKIVKGILKPNTLTKFDPKELRGILWCLRRLNFKEAYMIQLLEDRLPQNNKGVNVRLRQRTVSADDKKWPTLLTSRKRTP